MEASANWSPWVRPACPAILSADLSAIALPVLSEVEGVTAEVLT